MCNSLYYIAVSICINCSFFSHLYSVCVGIAKKGIQRQSQGHDYADCCYGGGIHFDSVVLSLTCLNKRFELTTSCACWSIRH